MRCIISRNYGLLLRLALFSGETISRGVEDPWVVVGAFHASEEPDGLSWEFPGGKRARVGKGAFGLSFDITLLLPFLEVS